jgi:hypothetical protein
MQPLRAIPIFGIRGMPTRPERRPKGKGVSNLISTVAENRKGYTLRQFERAKEARKLYHIVGTPTMNNFKSLLWMNVIQNCPVTVEDVNISEKRFGPDMSSLKGKSTRRKPKPVRSDLIEIPSEIITKHHDIDLCMDAMYVSTTVHSIRFSGTIIEPDL